MQQDLIYTGKPVKIADRFGKILFVDFERLTNIRKSFCRVVYKKGDKWLYKYTKPKGIYLIHKTNIQKFL